MQALEPHQVLTGHLPTKRWFGWLPRCADCDVRYPCPQRVEALDELAGRVRTWWSA